MSYTKWRQKKSEYFVVVCEKQKQNKDVKVIQKNRFETKTPVKANSCQTNPTPSK